MPDFTTSAITVQGLKSSTDPDWIAEQLIKAYARTRDMARVRFLLKTLAPGEKVQREVVKVFYKKTGHVLTGDYRESFIRIASILEGMIPRSGASFDESPQSDYAHAKMRLDNIESRFGRFTPKAHQYILNRSKAMTTYSKIAAWKKVLKDYGYDDEVWWMAKNLPSPGVV